MCNKGFLSYLTKKLRNVCDKDTWVQIWSAENIHLHDFHVQKHKDWFW